MTFLPDPAAIRKCLVESLGEAKSLDAAVAFAGQDWDDLIGTFSGPIRVVCWLSSTNTNPHAVEEMMDRKNIRVRQLPAMHAKVYILKGDAARCIVGSANLSKAALSEENALGQYEAAICVADNEQVNSIRRWFKALWQEAGPISLSDLEAAKERWKEAQSNRKKSAKSNTTADESQDLDSHFSEGWEPSDELQKLADEIRDMNLSQFDEYQDVLTGVLNNGERDDVEELIRCVTEWSHRKGAHLSALEEPSHRIQQALEVLFDPARSIESRLQDLDVRGPCKISGFALASLSMILYWRYPTKYLPYDSKTKQFLRDFGFERHLPKTLSPVQYGKWIAFAQELSARLELPSTGHVDRLVWKHNENKHVEI